MDFGVMGFDNLVGLSSSATSNGDKHKGYGSGVLKQEGDSISEEDFREFKVAKTSSCDDPIPLQRSNSETHQQMLSFSSPHLQNMALPYYLQGSAVLGRNTGYGYGATTIQGVKSPFTPSQWMELEHQALIYKYITANVPIPSYLLNPIRKAFESAGFSHFPTLKSNSLAWGAFHLGFSNADPEPGRCRRTDGKKWRCSRDAVVDQKYCERHMNRGRHRSRKPVEGHSGAGAAAKKATAVAPMGSSNSAGVALDATLGLSNHNQSLQPACNGNSINRGYLSKENGNDAHRQTAFLSMASPKHGLKDKSHDSIPRQHHNAYEGSSCPEFGLVCSDSLLNPMNKSSSLVHSQSFNSSDDHHHRDKSQQNALRQFINDCPRNQSVDRTHLSISTPNEELTNSLQRPLHELEMGLGMIATGDTHQKQTNKWVPISCESPLGEVLHKNSDNCSPALSSSSPRGILQRGAFWSLSNSSTGSSPRGDCLYTGLMNPTLPAL